MPGWMTFAIEQLLPDSVSLMRGRLENNCRAHLDRRDDERYLKAIPDGSRVVRSADHFEATAAILKEENPMSFRDRRAAARRRAWGRGPMILRFEPLEGRQLLSTVPTVAPDLVATTFSTPANLDWGDSFQAQGTIENIGGTTTPNPYQIDVYASPTPTLAAGAVLIAELPMSQGLMPGATQSFNQTVDLPSLPIPGVGADSSFYLNLVVDPYNLEGEGNVYDKLNRGLGIDTSQVTITQTQASDLVGQGLSVVSDGNGWGGNVTVSATVANNGTGPRPRLGR